MTVAFLEGSEYEQATQTRSPLRHVTTLVEVDLYEVDGNAFALIAAFRKAARRQGAPQSEIDAVINDCTSGDYEHLVAVLFENTKIT